jgi:hypothetical protein
MKFIPAVGVLFLLACPAPVLAQGVPSVAFPQVTATPVPLQSASGRYSSLNPPNRIDCPYTHVSGRVVSPRLILVKKMNCGRPGHDNVLVNIRFANPADAAQMVTGREVTITAKFTSAVEDRDPLFFAEFLIADQARLSVSRDSDAPPAQPFTSYMLCQPPELDALAGKLGKELCVQNTLLANLAELTPALEAAARAPAKLAPGDAVPGDPNMISCRQDPGVSDLHLPAVACARGSYWAWYRAKWLNTKLATPAPP